MIVVLKTPSLAQRVAAAGGVVGTRQERAWTRNALSAQKLLVSRLALSGCLGASRLQLRARAQRLLRRRSTRARSRSSSATRTSSASTRSASRIRRRTSTDVLSRADFGPGSGHRPDIGISGRRRPRRDDRAPRHGRRSRGAVSPRPRPRRHRRGRRRRRARSRPRGRTTRRSSSATARRWPGCSSARAGRRASRASRPARPSSRSASPAGSRTRSGTGRSTRAATRSSRASIAPSTRTTTATRTTPPASRSSRSRSRSPASPTGPEARAAAGALALDTLVVAPSGNDGTAAAGYGDIAGPGGAPAALTVGALDARTQRGRGAHRRPLRARHDARRDDAARRAPSRRARGSTSPSRCRAARSAARRRTAPRLVDFFNRTGGSIVAGRAALVPVGASPAPAAERAADGGRRRRCSSTAAARRCPPAGSGCRSPCSVPVVSLPLDDARAAARAPRGRRDARPCRSARRARVPIAGAGPRGELLVVRSRVRRPREARPRRARRRPRDVGSRRERRRLAALRHRERVERRRRDRRRRGRAARAGAAVARRGRAQGPPRRHRAARSPADPVTAQGSGNVDVGAAVAGELAASPATLAFGRSTGAGWRVKASFTLTNLSTRTVRAALAVRTQDEGAAAVDFSLQPEPRAPAPRAERARSRRRAHRVGAVGQLDGGRRDRREHRRAAAACTCHGRSRSVPSDVDLIAQRDAVVEVVQGLRRDAGAALDRRRPRARRRRAGPRSGRSRCSTSTCGAPTARASACSSGCATCCRADTRSGSPAAGPSGQLLPPGNYVVKIVGYPVEGGPLSRHRLPFTLR